MNFEEVYKDFKIYVRNRHKKQGFYNIIHDFNCRVLPYFRKSNVYEISKLDLIKWQDKILSLNFSNSYNKRLYYVFTYFLDYCCNYCNLENNLLREIGPFPKKIEVKKTDYYTIKEFNQFIKCVEHPIYKEFFNLMFFCGTRPSEAMALKFSDIDGNYITINKSIQRRGSRDIDTPKNKSSIRKILISKKIKKNLFKLKKYYIDYYHDDNYNYFIFGGKIPLSPSTIDRYKLSACKKANIRPITQHQFRHSYATFLISNGIPINVVSGLLGHSSVDITAKVYIHKDFSQEKRVLRTLTFSNFKIYVRNPLVSILKHF